MSDVIVLVFREILLVDGRHQPLPLATVLVQSVLGLHNSAAIRHRLEGLQHLVLEVAALAVVDYVEVGVTQPDL